MKNLIKTKEINKYRIELMGNSGNENCGAFKIPYEKHIINVIASSNIEIGWEHVSVSIIDLIPRIPTWDEMCFIKRLFFHANETVIQYHPSEKDYININPYVLHLWKPKNIEIPMPPKHLI